MFGTVISGRLTSELRVEQFAKQTTSPIALHLTIEGDETLETLQQTIDTITAERAGLEQGHRPDEHVDLGWQSQSLLTVQPVEYSQDANGANAFDIDAVGFDALGTYAVTLKCQFRDDSILLRLDFDSTKLAEPVASRLTGHFQRLLREVCCADRATVNIRDLDMMTEEDLRRVWNWNAEALETVEGCVQSMFTKSVERYPHQPAVCAWDGDLSYTELDKISNRLAGQLIQLGLQPGTVVPLVFEKSMWMPVAQFAVMKAGAASVGIDPAQPKDRIKTIIGSVGDGLVMSGSSTASLVSEITGREPFVIQHETTFDIAKQGGDEEFADVLPSVKPSDLLYLVFTSGTTGTPKGATTTHANFMSAIRHQKDLLNRNPQSRVANFSSYAFDITWSDMLHTFAVGGCMCIPSEHEKKNDLVKFLIEKKVTSVHLTPSIAAILELDTVPTLDTVILIGEVVDYDKLPHLRNIENNIITYGPSECTVTTTGIFKDDSPLKSTIGYGSGATTWIVNPDKNALTPVGLIGELFLEGPLVGSGYFNDPVKTSATFIEDPDWLLRGGPGVEGRRGRLYRTGDLVRYNDNGELIFLGRKDTQVKINGVRTELGDVEHHIFRFLQSSPAVADVIAELIKPEATQRPVLAAFLRIPNLSLEELTKEATAVIETLTREMPKEVPPHMVPGLFIPMIELPMTLTGKTDRRTLREIGASIDPREHAALYTNHYTQHIEPTTGAEVQLSCIWASLLGIPLDDIGAQDNFLRLGGDSIKAIRLAAAVREQGMSLKVADIMSHPHLRDMASFLSQNKAGLDPIPPFSLLGKGINQEEAIRHVAESCSFDATLVDPSQVEDIFPCTALQEGLLALTTISPGKYTSHHIAELKEDVDIWRFQQAWQKVSEKASVLRSRIVDLPDQGLVQVILREQLPWQTLYSLDDYRRVGTVEANLSENANDASMGLGTPLSRFAIIHDKDGKTYFGWRQHHSIYDGWVSPLLLKEIEIAYGDLGAELSSIPLQSFVKHVQGQQGEDGTAFWRQQFAGIEASHFPTLPEMTYQPKADKVISHSIKSIGWPPTGVTQSSAIRTAWATLLSWYTDSPDVVFGVVSSGRQASVPRIEDVAGPTIATVPFRVLVEGTVDGLLNQVQQQATDMIPFEQYGLQHIRQISDDAKYACDFQTLVLIHPPVEKNMDSYIFEHELVEQSGPGSENAYAMMLTCQLSDSDLHVQLSFDSAVVEEERSARLLQQLEHILGHIGSVEGSTQVTQLTRVSQKDLDDIWSWNAIVPDTVADCVHTIFAERVQESPDAPAVCAWDGELTYGELDRLSTQLAGHLLTSSLVAPGAIVPLYFEKSMWVPVAIFAVMKAGATCVALDATLPESRLQSIVSQLSAHAILTSKSCAKLATHITDAHIVEVGDTLAHFDGYQRAPDLPAVDPSSDLYIVFTSGSTGAPKGATVTHANFCSAIRYQQQQLGLTRASRVFDYTSYAFDVAWSNVLHALTMGACLCIPSEDERTADVAGAINRLGANFAHLTPTVGRFLDVASLGGLEKVLFIGEALTASDVARWKASNADIYNTYGPAECTVTSTIEKVHPRRLDEPESVGDPGIGVGAGCLTWIVQPRARGSLAAVGTVGELWLEGPIVGAGYLNNAEKTADAFVEDPEWLTRGVQGHVPGRRGRLYRTGDLVYYKADGSLGFVGRKDSQVKINGQRMELGEVEYHVRQLLVVDTVSQIVADVITPDATHAPALAVFLAMAKESEADISNPATASLMVGLREELSRLLPSYMVPTAYIPLAKLPMTATGKTDRKAIRDLGKAYSPPSLSPSSTALPDAVLTTTETTLRGIWAGLLRLEPGLVSPGHGFADIGGDSIKTMSLAMAIRKQFDVNIGVPRLINERHSLRTLASLIDSLSRGQAVQEMDAIDVELEVDLLVSEMQRSRGHGRAAAPGSTVFLTGSTGFLGTQILRHALHKRAFERIVVLVRSRDAEDGLCRVRQAASTAGWWRESFTSALDVWPGDLAAANLGLDDAQWRALCGLPSPHAPITAIIHNGARVHWATSYAGLHAANVASTQRLLHAALDSPHLTSLVYISGGLITENATWTAAEAAAANGYDQSKYVSEKLVRAVGAAYGTPAKRFSVVKPGQIIGDAYTGVANADDFLWRVVGAAMQLSARPVEPSTSWLAVSDVRSVADTVLWHAVGRHASDLTHITQGMPVSAFWACVDAHLHTPLRPMSWDEWIALARRDMARDQERHPLWPVQHFLGALGIEGAHGERDELDVREVAAAVAKNMEFLRERGVLGKGRYGQAVDGVMTRTRALPVVQAP
ncbi:putative nonribosomal peptide synthase [Karstenula rhodostoma CBS 690.94]|uniref:Nonribosomal peptide synthase n=1 Tax=Karstenula rhodostoma CBS 690.94 TaxID=1392251 RepID=A0A9P4UBE5_9PLEO|nr:putative nonribosomal peptide synthase [Karstenula rhodostoma CBS 690.94]